MDGKIYIIGGKNQDSPGELASTEVYDPAADTWMTLPPIVLAREKPQAEVINGTIYAIGGSYEGAGLPIVEKYALTSGGDSVPDAPANLTATAGDTQINLSWDPVSGATSYTVMRAAGQGGPYTAIATGITETSYGDTEVISGATYYYVVTAVSESVYSSEAFATLTASTPAYNALLRITMITGEIKEYQMDSAEIEAFVSWCDSEGAADPVYRIEKSYNPGPFSAREEYIVYDKIVSFEVLRY